MRTPAADGLVIVDKPSGWTSHDVVAKTRRFAATRRVGHAGTLDPMATGVLVLGVGRATRLLGHLALTDKTYDATIRLGQSTVTDDAEGDVIARASAADVTDDAIRGATTAFIGAISQIPSAVSAVKIDGVRAYKRVRDGEAVELPARSVTVSTFDVLDIRRAADVVDVDVTVVCSSGTYIRALARDLGAALGVGGHLTVLRRTRVGPYGLDLARTVTELEAETEIEAGPGVKAELTVIPLAEAVATAFPRRDVTAEEAMLVTHGRRLPALGGHTGPIGVFGPDGALLSLVEERDGVARPLVVFAAE